MARQIAAVPIVGNRHRRGPRKPPKVVVEPEAPKPRPGEALFRSPHAGFKQVLWPGRREGDMIVPPIMAEFTQGVWRTENIEQADRMRKIIETRRLQGLQPTVVEIVAVALKRHLRNAQSRSTRPETTEPPTIV